MLVNYAVYSQFVMIDDINKTSGSANQNGGPFTFTSIPAKGIVLFWAFHPDHGIELWKSNGSANNATLVKEIIPGTNGITSQETYNMVSAYDRAYFYIDDKVNGTELWVSDGTDAGTHIVTDYCSGTTSSYPSILMVDSIYAIVYAFDGGSKGVYKTDGTSVGTIKFGGTSIFYPPTFAYKYNGDYYYISGDVYRSDGTAKSQQLVITANSMGVYSMGGMVKVKDSLYLGINNTSTSAQLRKVKADFSGWSVLAQWPQNGQNAGPPISFYKFGDNVYYRLVCQYYIIGSYELHHIDVNTNAINILDTFLETSLNPHFAWLTGYKGNVYFRAMTKVTNKRQLYMTNGTRSGTRILTSALEDGIATSVAIYKDTLYFIENEKQKLWNTDGTAAGTKMISGNNKVFIPFYDVVGHFHNFNDTALIYGGYFSVGNNGLNIAEVWKLYGNNAPTSSIFNTNILLGKNWPLVFPNPSKDQINIKSDLIILKVEIYDMTGKLQLSSDITRIDVNGFLAGVYLIRVYSMEGMSFQKFVKN